jgi:beta-lactamase class A
VTGGEVAYCLLDARGDVIAHQARDRPFYAASTMKLAVAVAVARAVDAGRVSWSDAIEARRSFASTVLGAGIFSMNPDDRDEEMSADGSTLSVLELVRAMITRSSNEATNLLLEVVGIPAAAEVWAGVDPGSRLERLIGDVAAQAEGATNEVTPFGLAQLLHLAVTGRLVSPESTGVIIEALMAQEFPCIAEILPDGTVWGSKSGWVEGIEHDVGFCGDPTGDALMVLAVCTEGFPERQGRAEIRRIAGTLLRQM